MKKSWFDYVGVPGVLAFAVVGAVVGLAVAGRPVPVELARLAYAAVAFYFGVQMPNIKRAAVEMMWTLSRERRQMVADYDSAMSLLSELHSRGMLEAAEDIKERAQSMMTEWWG